MLMKQRDLKRRARNCIYIILGTMLYAGGISLFLDPNNLAPGGVIGISVILNRFTNIGTGILYFVINIPIVILGIKKLGLKFMTSTFATIILNSFLTDFFAKLGPVTREPLLAALAGGICIGLGIGIIFRAGSTTGGMDIVVKVIKLKYKHLKTGVLFMMFDIVIVAISGIVFGKFDFAMYAFIAVFVSGRTMDIILYGGDEARLIYIISDKAEIIAERVLKELDTGITFLEGKGAYSNDNKKVIMCVLKKQIAPKIEDIIKEEDEHAFMIISSANEIYGEGYKNIMGARL